MPARRRTGQKNLVGNHPKFFCIFAHKTYGITGILNLCGKSRLSGMPVLHNSDYIPPFCKICNSSHIMIAVLFHPSAALYIDNTGIPFFRLISRQREQKLHMERNTVNNSIFNIRNIKRSRLIAGHFDPVRARRNLIIFRKFLVCPVPYFHTLFLHYKSRFTYRMPRASPPSQP